MAEVLRVGNVEIFQVIDTYMRGDPTFMYPSVSDEMWESYRHWKDERGLLNLTVGTYVVRSRGTTILVDTGIGDKPREGWRPGKLLGNLMAEGVQPDDVDIVLNTHLHIDHVGWNTVAGRDGRWQVTFPNARYLFQQADWDYWTQPEVAAQNECILDSVEPLRDSPQLQLVGPEHKVTDEVTLLPAPGHTPGHVAALIASQGERAVIIGDACHHPVQISETEWQMIFDLDGGQASASRRRLVERIERERALCIGGHFPAPGFGRIVSLGSRRYWEAVTLPSRD